MTESKPRGIARLLDFPRVYSRFADCIGGTKGVFSCELTLATTLLDTAMTGLNAALPSDPEDRR